VISFEEFCTQTSFFQTKWGRSVAKAVYHITGLDRVYQVYFTSKEKTHNGQEFVDEVYRQTGVETVIEDPEALQYFIDNEVFVTVSNHPFGMYDGMSLVRTISTVRPDIRGITNFLLSKIEPIAHHFIPVNPFAKSTSSRSSLPGLRIARQHLADRHPLFFFPSGQVSHITRRFKIEDREWQSSSVKFIQKSKVPVIPIFFYGHNSWKFLLIGLIHPVLRTLFIPSEILSKRGRKIVLHIGEPISVAEQSKYKTPEEFGRFLYQRTYALKNKTL